MAVTAVGITGTLFSVTGSAEASARVVFNHDPWGASGFSDGTMAAHQVQAIADGSGEIDQDVPAGPYLVTTRDGDGVWSEAFEATVSGAADIAEIAPFYDGEDASSIETATVSGTILDGLGNALPYARVTFSTSTSSASAGFGGLSLPGALTVICDDAGAFSQALVVRAYDVLVHNAFGERVEAFTGTVPPLTAVDFASLVPTVDYAQAHDFGAIADASTTSNDYGSLGVSPAASDSYGEVA